MKRHPALIPLSHEHHHTLALCTRILRHPETDHSADINEHYIDLEKHFVHEETMFAPLWEKLGRDELRGRFEALMSIVNETNADLLIVGNRGINSLTGRLLGSVPADVARQSDCDVMIVHTVN